MNSFRIFFRFLQIWGKLHSLTAILTQGQLFSCSLKIKSLRLFRGSVTPSRPSRRGGRVARSEEWKIAPTRSKNRPRGPKIAQPYIPNKFSLFIAFLLTNFSENFHFQKYFFRFFEKVDFLPTMEEGKNIDYSINYVYITDFLLKNTVFTLYFEKSAFF